MLKRWVAYYLLLLLSLVFALLMPGRTSSAIFYALLALPLMSLAAALVMLAGFRYEQNLERMSAVKGDAVAFRLTLRNRCPLMLPGVQVSFHDGGAVFQQDLRARVLSVPPLSAADLSIPLNCRYRGSYELGVRQIRLYDYLGLFSFKQDIPALGTLTVYPRILPVDGFPVMAGPVGESSRLAAKSHENAESVSDIRKYVRGDRLRTIHWKLSAKKDELMVKNFEQTSGASAEIVIDASGIAGCAEEIIAGQDRLVECAVSLAWHFVARSIPVSAWHFSRQAENHAIGNEADFRGYYRLLSEASFEGAQTLPEFTELAHGSGKTVAIVAASLSEPVCALAMKARSAGCMAAVIHVAHNALAEDETERMKFLPGAGVLLLTLGESDDLNAALARRAV